MAKQIIWSPLAKEALKDLLISSQERDGNKRCGGALYTLFQNALYRVTLNPFIGQPTEAENIRYIIPHPDYTLLYRHSLRKIEVLVLWNNHHKLGSMIKHHPGRTRYRIKQPILSRADLWKINGTDA